MASSSEEPQPKGGPSAVGILSIGDMGVGIAKLLIAKGFTVVTNVAGRSEDTVTRASEAGIKLLETDATLVSQSAVIFSVVPPRDAVATAQRIIDALPLAGADEEGLPPLFYADLNAVSPTTASHVASLFDGPRPGSSSRPVTFIDGCILGGPPHQVSPDSDPSTPTPTSTPNSISLSTAISGWSVPGIPTSGPSPLTSIPTIGPRLSSVLAATHLSPEIGAASGLKMCFASLSKGYVALAVESFTTAHRLGVLPHLRAELASRLPLHARVADAAVVAMPPKAYRWVREMEEISDTHRDTGGFADEAMFQGAAAIYRTIADDTVLGKERVGKRERGTTVEDVTDAVADGLDRKRKKTQ